MRELRIVAALLLPLAAAVGQAQVFNVAFDTTKTQSGGAIIKASYDLGKSCAKPDDIRWLQTVDLVDPTTKQSKPIEDFPTGRFIDPYTGQQITGFSMADNQPWYDLTYKDEKSYDQSPLLNALRGAGSFLSDQPRGWNQNRPISFLANTYLVCIKPKEPRNQNAGGTFSFLAGFSWGFTITDDEKKQPKEDPINPTILPAQDLGALSKSINGIIDSTNAYSMQHTRRRFAPWTMTDKPCCDKETWTLNLVPEPGTLPVMAFGALPFASSLIFRRRRCATSDA